MNGADGRHSRAFYRKAGTQRAHTLVDWLVANGLDEARFEAASAGADRLLFPDPVYAWHHEANRRVEIEVISH